MGIPAVGECALPDVEVFANFGGNASWVTLLEAVGLGDGPGRDASGGHSPASCWPAWGGRCKRGGHCKWNGKDERSDPVGTPDLELTAGMHRKMVKFGHKPQGCVHELG